MALGLLSRAFTLGKLLRSGWFFLGVVLAIGGLFGGGYWQGYRVATNSCELQKERSKSAALKQASQANRDIGEVRVQAERERTRIAGEIRAAEEVFGNVEYVQDALVRNGCELDPDSLQLLNGAILRASRSDR